MKNCRILAGFMVVFFVAFLSLSAAAHARDDDDSDSGHRKKGEKLPKHARVLQAQINDNKESIENIELTPGPQGDNGDTGDTGAIGATGASGADGQDGATGTTGADGLSIQGPQGDPGTSRWADNDPSNTVETTGSVKIGDDGAACTSTNEGTIRFKTDIKIFEGCNGTAWVSLSSAPGSYAIGDTGPAGGIVFYITNYGLSGLEAAPVDQSTSANAEWGCLGIEIAGADGTAVGTGAQNTADILTGCSTSGIAAKIADAYMLGTYDDWYLPSKDELNLLYQQRNVVGGFASGSYWSSSELGSNYAWTQGILNGVQGGSNKGFHLRVRAVRTF